MKQSSEAPAAGPGVPGARPEQKIYLQGHSGCEVALIGKDGLIVVEKSALDPKYNSRLQKQIQKQMRFAASNRLPFVKIPKILEQGQRQELAMVRMEYVYYLNSIDYFETASITDIDEIVAKILAYIDSEIGESEVAELPTVHFADKLREIESNVKANGHIGIYQQPIKTLESILRNSDRIRLPLGSCHGDLTFSNILIASDSKAIALIDFLDSFIESPIIDIAKIRQDSRFCWSLMMAAHPNDATRFRLVMRYIDEKINRHYSDYDWYVGNIDLILLLNMLRIAPYAKRDDVHEFLIDAINALGRQR